MEVAAFIAWAILLGLIGTRRYVGNPTTVTLLQYQAGLMYRKGCLVRELDAGQHRVRAGVEKMVIVDKRPTMVSFENRGVALVDGATAVFGFSGSAEIRNVSRALYSARNYNEIPAFVLLCCTRLTLNGCTSGNLLASREALTDEVVAKARARLADAGFDLQSFRFTHLSIVAPAPAKPSGWQEGSSAQFH
ncbi:MAG: SPFH domain-containing protein [Terriglobales bacterium]